MQKFKGITATGGGKERSSNLELYRIICMMLIVAHHCVVNSGLTSSGTVASELCGPMVENRFSLNTLLLWAFGMWGKTGINCFLMITGYFMCTSNITLRKFVKLILWIYIYKITIFTIFLFTGYESLSIVRLAKLISPVWGFNTNFTSCFIGFWLTIPFWNILIRNMSKHQHELFLCLLLGMYTVFGSIPGFNVSMNYVTWFGVIYSIASYIRLYPNSIMENKKIWMMATFLSVLIALCSMVCMSYILGKGATFFVSDSNKILAVVVAVSSFMWFKNMNIRYSKVINTIGASTFGVLLIHANSDAMRQWLWKETVDCVGHYSLPSLHLVLYFTSAVTIIFFSCIIIDRVRIILIEKPFFRWYDKKPRFVRLQDFLKEK